ncbi:hypothetical protein CPCC7001_1929 [Cyanobium sp. PCC 7001]|uniref:hypothetical protein n=1 Tax=Cyanobium sp. PCC 7001 TaxID=180281 RepID=UPI0001805D61|nr:hypothetical protein [Cyanobium sp. PCC 7001]EDY39050.1 hypothetical protein CPCC7001_1929 [Cyanobium sp. PCC 7001]
MTAPAASPSKVRALLRLWSLALALSAALVAAGERWPQPLRPDPVTVAALVLGLPLGVALLVLLRWRLPPPPAGGPAGHRGESSD